jgi:hypothetical protein
VSFKACIVIVHDLNETAYALHVTAEVALGTRQLKAAPAYP